MSATLQVDTETFSDDYDFNGFARRLLAGEAGGVLPTDQGPLDWVERAKPLLAKSPFEARLFEALAACLTDSSPTVRLEALRVFEKFPAAPGAQRITELARTSRLLFQPDADDDLEWKLLRAVGARMSVGDDTAKQIGHEEALNPEGRAEPLIAALASYDADWVIANAEAIVTAHPDAGSTILFNLERVGREIGALGARIAPIAAAGDKNFKKDIKRYLDSSAAKVAILAAASVRR